MTTSATDWSKKAKILDKNDHLKHLRERFNIPLARNTCDNSKIADDRKCIYLNGNSLGCMVCIYYQGIVFRCDQAKLLGNICVLFS